MILVGRFQERLPAEGSEVTARGRFTIKSLPGEGSEFAAWCQPLSDIFAGLFAYCKS